jgi:hypothetical protein
MSEDLFDGLFENTNTTINTSKHEFREYIFDPADFVTFPVIWYGGTGSGKTFHLKYCLNSVKHFFPKVILFSPTNSISGDFKGIINPALCFSELNETTFVNCINALMEIADLYRNTVNNLKNLEAIFSRCADQDETAKYQHIQHLRGLALDHITSNPEDSEAIKAGKIQKLVDDLEQKLVLFFKHVIIPKRHTVNIEGLTEEQLTCLQNIDMNPRTLIIFDDQQEELKELSRKKGTTGTYFKNLFTKSRHYLFNVWLVLQEDSALIPQIRKACKISILTDPAVATGFINRNTNCIDKESQRLGMDLVSSIFTNPEDRRKIIFFKERTGEEKFQFHSAKDSGLFKMGSVAINEFCNSVLN